MKSSAIRAIVVRMELDGIGGVAQETRHGGRGTVDARNSR
jgi:hypothetical protein